MLDIKKGREAVAEQEQEKGSFDYAKKLKDGEVLKVRFISLDEVVPLNFHDYFGKFFSQLCTTHEVNGEKVKCPLCVLENEIYLEHCKPTLQQHDKAEKDGNKALAKELEDYNKKLYDVKVNTSKKQRNFVGVIDLSTGEVMVLDVTSKQWGEMSGVIEDYEDMLETTAFKVTRNDKTIQVTPLPSLKKSLTPEEQENFNNSLEVSEVSLDTYKKYIFVKPYEEVMKDVQTVKDLVKFYVDEYNGVEPTTSEDMSDDTEGFDESDLPY